jgi:hypothetical protein
VTGGAASTTPEGLCQAVSGTVSNTGKLNLDLLRSFVASEFFGFGFAVSFVITLLSQSGEEERRRKEKRAAREAERRRKEWKRQRGRRDRYLVYYPAGLSSLLCLCLIWAKVFRLRNPFFSPKK